MFEKVEFVALVVPYKLLNVSKLIIAIHAIEISIPYDTPYLCLKKAGGNVDNTSTRGRSTTTISPEPRKSAYNIGR
jgi:hypothetical protein